MVFPRIAQYDFEPVDDIDDNYGLYEYGWPRDMTWAAGAGARFRRDIVNWFRLLPRGRYRVLLRVLYDDDGQATVAHGTREVSAPLTREDLLEGDGHHAGILPGLQHLIEGGDSEQVDEESVLAVQMHIWRGGYDEIVLEDGSSDTSSETSDDDDGPRRGGSRRGGASQRGSSQRGSSQRGSSHQGSSQRGSQRGAAQRRGGQRRRSPRSARHMQGVRRRAW